MATSRFETESFTADHLVESAGTVLFRLSTREICIIRHLQRNEYLLPKGRRNLHESRQATAIRETTEETGIPCRLMPLNMLSRVCPPDAGSEDVPDEARFFKGACEPILVQTRRRVGQGEMKLIWWFVAAVDEERPAGPHEDKFGVEFLGYDVALERLTFKDDRDLVGRAIDLVESTLAS
ncbi:NUDIX domain-containing protein [Fusarium napiforme]|uniref:NUDIX domain-containing protein n=1 Tax=Fusarium napiforme TaxID=42672 RepID=A0A8H5MSP3_9HYPO|nr:NUDIX domain-containing protein [Fusarium napiforme]